MKSNAMFTFHLRALMGHKGIRSYCRIYCVTRYRLTARSLKQHFNTGNKLKEEKWESKGRSVLKKQYFGINKKMPFIDKHTARDLLTILLVSL